MQKSAKLAGTNLGRMTSQKIREPNQSPHSSPSLRSGKIKNVLLVIGRNSWQRNKDNYIVTMEAGADRTPVNIDISLIPFYYKGR
jgi:hypothetical protein